MSVLKQGYLKLISAKNSVFLRYSCKLQAKRRRHCPALANPRHPHSQEKGLGNESLPSDGERESRTRCSLLDPPQRFDGVLCISAERSECRRKSCTHFSQRSLCGGKSTRCFAISSMLINIDVIFDHMACFVVGKRACKRVKFLLTVKFLT